MERTENGHGNMLVFGLWRLRPECRGENGNAFPPKKARYSLLYSSLVKGAAQPKELFWRAITATMQWMGTANGIGFREGDCIVVGEHLYLWTNGRWQALPRWQEEREE